MADSLGRLIVTLEAQTAKYQKGMEDAKRQLEAFRQSTDRNLGGMNASFEKFSKGIHQILVGGGIIAGFHALYSQLDAVAKKFEGTDKAANIWLDTTERLKKTLDQAWLLLLQHMSPAIKALGDFMDPLALATKRVATATEDLAKAEGLLARARKEHAPGRGLSAPGGASAGDPIANLEKQVRFLQGALDAANATLRREKGKAAAGKEVDIYLDQESKLSQLESEANKKSAAAAAKRLQDQTNALVATYKEVAALQESATLMQLSADEAFILNLQLEGASDAQIKLAKAALETKHGLEDQARVIEEIAKKDLDRLKMENDLAKFFEEEKTSPQERIKADLDRATEQGKEFADQFSANLVEAADGGFKAVLHSWVLTLEQMALKAAAANLFEDLFPAGIHSGSTGFAGVLWSIFGTGRATGGPVAAGMPYMVGERGPEMFIPNTSGSIMPNGGGAVNVYNNVTVGDVATRSQLVSGLAMIKEQTKKEVADSMFRRRMR